MTLQVHMFITMSQIAELVHQRFDDPVQRDLNLENHYPQCPETRTKAKKLLCNPNCRTETQEATYFNSVTVLGERAAFQEKPTQERIDLWEKVREEGCVLPQNGLTEVTAK